MKRCFRWNRLAIAGGVLLAAPAASCSLEQSGLDSILAAVNGFQGNVQIKLQVESGGSGQEGDGHQNQDDHDQGEHGSGDHAG